MPYIKKEDRKKLLDSKPQNTGELNYCITFLLTEYLETKGEKYQTYNDMVGALECAKLELYRRKIGKYEDEKIESNGDVY